MNETTTGQCLCGASSFSVTEPHKFAIQCYCRDCQHVSGGGHLPQIGVARAAFSSAGPVKTYTQKSDAGSDLFFSFCAECGSPLFKATGKAADLVFVYPGALSHPPEVDFGNHVFESSRQPWDKG